MSDKVGFALDGFEHYLYWQTQDKRTLNKINKLIMDIVRNGNAGIGHPEPLKHDLSGNMMTAAIANRTIVTILFPPHFLVLSAFMWDPPLYLSVCHL